MKPLLIGYDRYTGRRIYLRSEDLESHGLVAGGTGKGKSQLAIRICHFGLLNGLCLLYLDPCGDGYRDMVAFTAAHRLSRRVITIDANEAADKAVFPLNFLAPNGLDAATHAGMIMKALAKVFREQDAETKPRLERRERATLIALIEAGYTLAEMLHFLAIADARFRQHVLSRVTNPYVLQEWTEFDRMAKRSDKETLIESVLNRAAKVIMNDPVRRVVGAATCNLDWEEIRRKRMTVLVNLQPAKVSKECQQLIGTMILDHLTNYAMQSTKRENRLLVLADEMDELASPDFSSMFQALRKRRVFCWSFFQYLEQLRSRDDTKRLFAAAMSCCDIKIGFHTSYEDGAILARELFPGSFRGDVIKDEIHRTLLLPQERRRRIIGSSVSESEAYSESEGYAEHEGVSVGMTEIDSAGASEGQTFGGANGTALQSSELSSMASAAGCSSGSVSGTSTSHSTTHSRATGRSRSQAIVPFYEYKHTKELASRNYYSAEDQLEERIATIQQQARRQAILKVGDQPPVSILVAFVKSVRVRPQDIQRTLDTLSARDALPVEQVDNLIESRRNLAIADKTSTAEVENSQPLEELFRPRRGKR